MGGKEPTLCSVGPKSSSNGTYRKMKEPDITGFAISVTKSRSSVVWKHSADAPSLSWSLPHQETSSAEKNAETFHFGISYGSDFAIDLFALSSQQILDLVV